MQLQNKLVMVFQADYAQRQCLLYVFTRLALVRCQTWL